jgi:drug/metabolite transporter (DMT)-like permease
MLQQFAVIILWAISYNVTGELLSGHIDSDSQTIIRLAIATGVMALFMPWVSVPNEYKKKLMILGTWFMGLMYITYHMLYDYLSFVEVMYLFTTAPLILAAGSALLNKQLKVMPFILGGISIWAVYYMKGTEITDATFAGIALTFVCLVAYNWGQVVYKKIQPEFPEVKHHHAFFWIYLGGLLAVIPYFIATYDAETIKLPTEFSQWFGLVFLAVVITAAGYWLLGWGATKVNDSQLAIFQNADVPTGLLVNVILFNTITDKAVALSVMGIILVLLYVGHKYNDLLVFDFGKKKEA